MVIFEFCSVGKKTGNIELHKADIGHSAQLWMWTWKLNLEDETLMISKIKKRAWYSSVPHELLYFTL